MASDLARFFLFVLLHFMVVGGPHDNHDRITVGGGAVIMVGFRAENTVKITFRRRIRQPLRRACAIHQSLMNPFIRRYKKKVGKAKTFEYFGVGPTSFQIYIALE